MPLILKDDHGNDLPVEIQDKVNTFIDSLKNVSWFKPCATREEITAQAEFVLKCFGVEASVEYRKLKTEEDWVATRGEISSEVWEAVKDATMDATMDTAMDTAMVVARDTARSVAWVVARDATKEVSWDVAWNAARAVGWAATEILAEYNKYFKKKYPHGAFKQLFKLWEMGVYPIGVVDGKFLIYIND